MSMSQLKQLTIFAIFVVFSSHTFAQLAAVDIKLSPAGSFTGKTNQVIGKAEMSGGKISAKNIIVKLAGLKTGIALRDEHTLNYLKVKEHPEAVLVSAVGENGKGTGTIRIVGIEQPISGEYKIDGNILKAEFPLKLSDFKITGIRYMGVGVKDEVKLNVEIPIADATAPAASAAPAEPAKSKVIRKTK